MYYEAQLELLIDSSRLLRISSLNPLSFSLYNRNFVSRLSPFLIFSFPSFLVLSFRSHRPDPCLAYLPKAHRPQYLKKLFVYPGKKCNLLYKIGRWGLFGEPRPTYPMRK